MDLPSIIEPAKLVGQWGGRLLAVGGALRDLTLRSHLAHGAKHAPLKLTDIDLVAFNISFEDLVQSLAPLGHISTLWRRQIEGALYKLPLIQLKRHKTRLEISLPRDLSGNFRPVTFLSANILNDAQARDFTANALYLDPLTGELFDPLGGLNDLRRMSLVPCSADSITLDPLRSLRAMNLIARRAFTAHPSLTRAVSLNWRLLSRVPRERLWPEWNTWAHSPFPHLGLHFLKESGLLNFYPNLNKLSTLPQGERFHPEGNVWNHTVLTVAALTKLPLPQGHNKSVLLLTALLHDIGKGVATPSDKPQRNYPDHARLGAPLVKDFLSSIHCPKRLAKPILKLILRHMDCAFSSITFGNLRQIARYLAPHADLADFWAITAADWNGRSPWPEKFPYTLEDFLEPVGGNLQPLEELLNGKELIALLGISEGREIGRLKKLIVEAQDKELIKTKEEALKLARENLSPQLLSFLK
ncbi:MAG: HD domain-containing protein [Deltaproteobacteria bacterium]|jgi:tRNA nucleotidyltransferase (CCA-adding enzyme)|nr:HD domain-containing protein [Deltaproteobacteria bacterium]